MYVDRIIELESKLAGAEAEACHWYTMYQEKEKTVVLWLVVKVQYYLNKLMDTLNKPPTKRK